MSFTRANALGWALYEVLTSTQMNHVDSQLPNALDGAAGGSYGATADINLTGVGTFGLLNGQWPALDTRTLYRSQGLAVHYTSNNGAVTVSAPTIGADFRAEASSIGLGVVQNFVDATPSTGVRPYVLFECPNVPDQSTIIGAGAMFFGPGPGTNPEKYPQIYLAEIDPSAGAITQYGTQTYSGLYRSQNYFMETTAISRAVDHSQSKRWTIAITGEAGSNAIAGFTIYQTYLKLQTTKLVP